MSTVMGTTSNNNVIDVEVYAKGEPGNGIESTIFEYQASDSSSIIPTGTWSTEMVTPAQGQYLWTRTTSTYTNGTTAVSYNISYFSIDGEDGGWYVPAVAADGTLSWTPSKAGLPSVESKNIRGPQGPEGSLKYRYVSELPTQNIENDVFYVMDAQNQTAEKWYDEYFYINNHWERFGSDLRTFWKDDEPSSI